MSTTETTSDATTANEGGQLTAKNRRVEIDAENFVYRRFGNSDTDAPPLLLSAALPWQP
jgi:hypothetical protein